ncbi:UDP-glucose 4-epimerase GalE [Brevundimonas faecalis]|uniref:UDP-glucose 4-epimerase GalE n=1 Tax=Brevundimonas faecalis TaxID=947378 RepID=UPI0036203B05
MTRNILVTGGAGYIGSHTCKALHAAGFKPIVLDDLVYGHERFVRWGPLTRGDIRDVDLVRQLIRDNKIEAVIHFAALAYVGESVSEPEKYYNNNVVGTLRLIQAMQATECRKIVFSSTCAIYGEVLVDLISEDLPAWPVNPYGRSKLVCEMMLEDVAAATDISFTALRYFNAAGGDPDGELGEDRVVETHLIPRAMMALRGHLDNFQVFGSDFPTPDGTAIRDYIHVTDLAEAHVQALLRMLNGAVGGAKFNLGTGQGFSVREVLTAIERVSGRALPEIVGPRRLGDPARLVADASLARRELAFRPRLSDLETIIETAWRWHMKAHPDLS